MTSYHETLNVWVTALTIFDVVMGLVIVALIVLRVRKTKRYKQQNKA